jgi:hypothetical protein
VLQRAIESRARKSRTKKFAMLQLAMIRDHHCGGGV